MVMFSYWLKLMNRVWIRVSLGVNGLVSVLLQ